MANRIIFVLNEKLNISSVLRLLLSESSLNRAHYNTNSHCIVLNRENEKIPVLEVNDAENGNDVKQLS